MSNANAQMVLNALGIPTDDELCGHMNRVQFANLCASWFQQHIGRPSAKIEMSVTRDARGPTFIDCGVPALLWVEMGLKSLITASSSQSWQASHRLPANGDLLAHSVTGANCRAEGGVKNAKMCFKAGMSTPETPKARGSSQNLIPELLGDTAPIWIAFGVHLRASLL
jgi:hypothetical protein